MPFDKNEIEKLYPQAGDLMWEPMLMWKLPKGKEDQLEQICDSGDYFASIKKDGLCYQFVKTQDYSYLFGRTISKKTHLLTEKIDNVPHLKEAFATLPPRTVIVLEVYYPGCTSKDATKILGCLPELAIKRQENNPIHGYAHDILYYDSVDLRNTGALNRYKILSAIWEKHDLSKYNFLELAQPIYDNIFEEASLALARGEEGLVLRKKDGVWSCSKRPAHITIKVKEHDTVDLICTGLCDATKEYTGKDLNTWEYWETMDGELFHGRYLNDEGEAEIKTLMYPVTKYYYLGYKTALKIGAYDDDGNLMDLGTVSSGLTDDMKRLMTENPDTIIGKVATLDCMSADRDSMTLRHPVFRCIREDKNPNECKISEVFN